MQSNTGNSSERSGYDGTLNENLENTKQAIIDTGKAIAGTAKSVASELKVGGQAIADNVEKRGNELFANTRIWVSEEPVKSICIAAGLGLFMGYLLRRG